MNLQVGDHVMVFTPHKIQGKQWKLVLPYRGPYQELELTPNIVIMRLVHVDQPDE